jgi:uncharacterized repeat protein (TIGR03803 family)
MSKAAFLLACLLPCAAAAAPGEKRVHSFGGPNDGAFPVANALIADTAGVLYGTASLGGANGFGVIYSLTPAKSGAKGWTYAVLHDFAANEGTVPYGSLLLDSSGAVIGTTSGGGVSNAGTVFRLTPPAKQGQPWVLHTLWSFSGGSDGAYPYAGVVADSTGTLYGTAFEGGTGNNGTVYALTPPAQGGTQWTQTTLYQFTGTSGDGSGPVAPVTLGTDGSLYGAAESGGVLGITPGCPYPEGCGVIFRLQQSGGAWQESLLHTFGATTGDGVSPESALTIGPDGTLYSNTSYGGETNVGAVNQGTIFSLTPPAGGAGAWTYTILREMGLGPDYLSIPFGAMALDASGVLTGAALDGGPAGEGGLLTHGGGIFTLAPPAIPGNPWTYSVKHQFTADSHDFCKSGCYPYGGPTLLPGHAVIGTTLQGGAYPSHQTKVGPGVIYELK